MRKSIFAFTLIALGFLSAQAAQPDFAKILQGKDGCFTLYDLKTDKVVCQYNETRCALRFAPCSGRSKLPLQLMALRSRHPQRRKYDLQMGWC